METRGLEMLDLCFPGIESSALTATLAFDFVRNMHTLQVLCEKILAIKLSSDGVGVHNNSVVASGRRRSWSRVRLATGSLGADPCEEIHVLTGDMSLPLILRAEDRSAASESEHTLECFSMSFQNMAREEIRVLEGLFAERASVCTAVGCKGDRGLGEFCSRCSCTLAWGLSLSR